MWLKYCSSGLELLPVLGSRGCGAADRFITSGRRPGTTSRRRSRRLPARSDCWLDRPVTLPPGRAKLATRESGLGATAKTIGMGRHPFRRIDSVHWVQLADVPVPMNPIVGSLCARRERPCHRHAETCDEVAPPHSITSSAVNNSFAGTSRPSALAALRLITSSNLVGRRTGRSAGLSPLRIRPV